MMGDFDGLVAAVTGGASGIGAAVETELAAQGARVAVLDLQPPDGSQHAVALRTDVTDDASVRAAVEQILAELGRLDVLVNNAGIGAQGTVEDNDDAEWLRVLDVNLLGMVRTSRAALPALPVRRHRQHRVDRRDGRPAAARPLQHDQGCRPRSDPRDGRGPPGGGDRRQLRQPR
jgi:2-keto-3-deoxy-L-fuconate dehydrogenase